MKRKVKLIVNILAFVLAAVCMSSCSLIGQGGGDKPREKAEFTEGDFKMVATVTDIGAKITVDVIEAEYASGVYWVNVSDLTAFVDRDGYKIDSTDIKVGDKVEITYNGQVAMSLPPQIAALSIKKL